MRKIPLPQEGLETLYGAHDANLKYIESLLDVEIRTQGDELIVEGDRADEQRVEQIFDRLKGLLDDGHVFANGEVKTAAQLLVDNPNVDLRDYFSKDQKQPQGTKRRVNPKTVNQRRYLESIERHDIVFGVGPAGTGKTYLAVAMAAAALLEKRVKRIILARPAVEAGERLGFLPGDLAEKVNPYLRPLHDALHDIIGYEKVGRMMERGIIEVAPIAFMRGRTLNDSFIIVDEAQNTTTEQMKMVLTRVGFNSKAVINGDVTQVDLPQGKLSGLREAQEVLGDVEGIKFFTFDQSDVVRHALVQKIVTAYDRHDRVKREREDAVKARAANVGAGPT